MQRLRCGLVRPLLWQLVRVSASVLHSFGDQKRHLSILNALKVYVKFIELLEDKN